MSAKSRWGIGDGKRERLEGQTSDMLSAIFTSPNRESQPSLLSRSLKIVSKVINRFHFQESQNSLYSLFIG